MTLSEIETILDQLASRHENIDKELLITLLTAAGWEEKVIKDALALFASRKTTNKDVLQSKAAKPQTEVILKQITSTNAAPLTFYQQDGNEENTLRTFVETAPPRKNDIFQGKKDPLIEQKPIEVSILKNVIDVPVTVDSKKDFLSAPTFPTTEKPVTSYVAGLVPTPSQFSRVTEPESLVVIKEVSEEKRIKKEVVIPDNLPLLPFESSPHVWSFSKYKDVFHRDIASEEKMKVITVMPQESSIISENKSDPHKGKEISDKEVILEAVPLNRQDESLAFLAGVMLLVIILILGYMYSNGRL